MKETIIVTAFIPLGRGEWDVSSRSDEKYFNAFQTWAGISNVLIVYTVTEYVDRVLEIRKRAGLEEKTQVREVKNFKLLDPALYSSIKTAMSNGFANKFRFYNENPEVTNCDYNYVMMLKYYFVSEVAREYESNFLMWIDFGFNYTSYYKADDLRFHIDLGGHFNDELIHLFIIKKEVDSLPVIEHIKYTDNIFRGAVFFGRSLKILEFCKYMRDWQINLNFIGLADQDQTIMLLCFRKYPNLIATHYCEMPYDSMKIVMNKDIPSFPNNSVPAFGRRLQLKAKNIVRKIGYPFR